MEDKGRRKSRNTRSRVIEVRSIQIRIGIHVISEGSKDEEFTVWLADIRLWVDPSGGMSFAD